MTKQQITADSLREGFAEAAKVVQAMVKAGLIDDDTTVPQLVEAMEQTAANPILLRASVAAFIVATQQNGQPAAAAARTW